MEKYRILQYIKNKNKNQKKEYHIDINEIISKNPNNFIGNIDVNNIDFNIIVNFKTKYPTFNIEYYKQFNLNTNNLNDLQLMYHYSTIGYNANIKFFEYDYTVDNYVHRLNESHPLYFKTQDCNDFRNISKNNEIRSYFNDRMKPYFICNKESFYKLYPDFDFTYYKKKYFLNTELSEIEILKNYHLIGKFEQKSPNNKIKIVVYTRPFDILCGGIVALHNIAKIINDAKSPNIYAKLFVYNNLKYNNIFCNQFETVDEINDNTIVIYPEVISGNPLNCKKVVRWILLSLGIEMPINHYETWGLTSLKNGLSSDGSYNLIYQWESIQNNIPQLAVPWFNPIFKNKNNVRTKTCYLIKKGILIHKNIKYIHESNSICIDNMSISEKCNIFNQCKRFYCYDPNTAYMIFAVSCGCPVIMYPLENVSKDNYFKNKIFNKDNKIYNAGIAYGNSFREISYAEKTLEEGINMYVNLFNEYEKTTIPFLEEIKKLL